MKVLVVYCHPVPESFCGSVKNVVVETLEKAGHEVDLLDLYAENFNPVMPAEERRIYNDMKKPEECAYPDHVARLMAVEGLIFVYPTWWYGFPAMLKGWFDRVWTPGAAFNINPDGGVITSNLRHIKRLGVVTMCGAPMWWSYAVGHPGKRTITRGVRQLINVKAKSFFLAHYLMDVSTPESRADYLEKVRARLAKL
ncbi:MAG: NAD(P)H-dependent oxidoreductase [Rhizobiaceae bacterium]|jgi:putative NADPH-quinone reductase|nr:NAD(P)H-dependent oxidoreductase [Rhizobiaceae bacterium]